MAGQCHYLAFVLWYHFPEPTRPREYDCIWAFIKLNPLSRPIFDQLVLDPGHYDIVPSEKDNNGKSEGISVDSNNLCIRKKVSMHFKELPRHPTTTPRPYLNPSSDLVATAVH